MQWSQIKTLFILCFLVLDVYLLIQFFDKQEKNDLDVMEERDSSIEQQLNLENIELPSELPDEEMEQSYISVKQKEFSKSDFRDISGSDNQNLTAMEDKLIVSKFDKPIPVKKSDDIKETVKSNILSADDYTYWGWNKDLNVILFFQEKKDQPVYYNDKGLVLLYLNDDNEIVGYTQTMLGEENKDFHKRKKPLIKPIQAIDTLYNNNDLQTGDKVTDVTLGYYTSQPIASDEQTFAPTWRITVNEERNYFIHATEGVILPLDDVAFLEDSMRTIKSSLATIKDDKDFKEISQQIDKRLKAIKRREEENDTAL